jgi:energy-converting hydrogenase Eha subunit C
MSKFKKIIAMLLAMHGIIHVIETILNIYENAYYSACLSFISSVLMILGAVINIDKEKISY